MRDSLSECQGCLGMIERKGEKFNCQIVHLFPWGKFILLV